VLLSTHPDAVLSRYVFITWLFGRVVYADADYPRPPYFVRVPNELKLMFADNLGLHDVNALARTSSTANRLLTPYIYLRAKHLRTIYGRPYFLQAVDAGNLTAVRKFIEVGCSVNVMDAGHVHLSTAIHSCVARGDLAIAELLVHNGANLSATNRFGATPLLCAVGCSHSSEAMVRLLLDAGADIFASCGCWGTVLYRAAKYGTASTVQLLLQRGAVAAIAKPDGDTPLHGAASQGSAATVRLLLEASLNIEATDNMGETPLHRATYYGNAENVEALLRWGANVGATDRLGYTPLHLAVKYWEGSGASEAVAHRILHLAPRADGTRWKGTEQCVPSCRFVAFPETIVDLLLDAGADIMATNDDNTNPLDWAIAHASGGNDSEAVVPWLRGGLVWESCLRW
jgi:ankyrin repeat protein